MTTTKLSIARRALAAASVLSQKPSRHALTDEQRSALEGWPGWGPLAGMFEHGATASLTKITDELSDALGEENFRRGSHEVDNAFFTSQSVIEHMWQLLRDNDFTGGRVLDLGCGSGRFAQFCPDGLDVEYHGLEIDPTSARIAELINPHARITNAPAQNVTIPPNSFDVAIGNVPFGSTSVYDKRISSRTLHGYFLRRAIDAVRPGGFVFIVTSRFHLDSIHGLGSVNDDAQLVGAVRLPSNAFSAEGTAVVADVLLLQKRDPLDDAAITPLDHSLGSLPAPESGGRAASVSTYFIDRPHMVAGSMFSTGNWHNNLEVRTATPGRAIERCFARLSKLAPSYRARTDGYAGSAALLTDEEGHLENEFVLIDGAAHQVVDGELVGGKNSRNRELIQLVELRDAVSALLEAEADWDCPDSSLEPLRADALNRYASYVSSYGPLNRAKAIDGPVNPETGIAEKRWRRPPMAGFRHDPRAELVFGIEDYDDDTGNAQPAAILLRRTNKRPVVVERVGTAAEAVTVSLSRFGLLHVPTIASLLGIDDAEVDAVLADLAFRDPRSGDLVEASEYLSGNIAERLVEARRAAELDPSFERNVAELEAVMPARLGPDDISVALGATWLTTEDVKAYLRHVGYHFVSVSHSPSVGLWEVDAAGENPAKEAELGTSRMRIADIVSAGLNGGVPVVYDLVEGPNRTTRRVRNASETALAGDRLAAINADFAVWLWSDPDRSDRVVDEYNLRFNSVVPRRADGSYLHFPSKSPDKPLWDNQLRGIDHILRCPHQGAMIAHTMGAGKTRTAVGAAIKMREYGLAAKPCITTPKPVLEQFAREARQLFPTARFLVATAEQVAGAAKRQFVARAATGDWDAVIMSHETFTSLSVDPADEYAYIEQELSELGEGENGNGAKAVAARRRKLQNRLDELKDTAHDSETVSFAATGIDALLVDEAHMFKNVPIVSRTPGLQIPGSKRAQDLLIKVRGLAAKRPGQVVCALFTGTPWSNSLAETYNWTSMCAPTLLSSANCATFDAWASTFVTFETVIETSPSGGALRANTRPVRIRNAPEARTMFQDFADMLPSSELQIERPDVDRSLLTAEPNEAQKREMTALSARIDALREAKGKPEKGDDNMLNVCNDGRLLALDPRLRGIDADSPKLQLAAEGIAGFWEQNKDVTFEGSDARGVFQLVCLDLGTPKAGGDTQAYGRLRTSLIERGVPADQVRFIHEAKNARAREALFADCREGRVAVLIGSSARCGLGVNVQSRLRALWHVDCPWTPSSKAQREGRAVRPGNLNSRVLITDIVTEGTFDGLVNAAVQRKHTMIEQMFTNAPMDREVVDVSSDAVSLAEVSAAATGHPELIEQAELAAELHKLKVARSSHHAQVRRFKQSAADSRYRSEHMSMLAELVDKLEESMPHSSRKLSADEAKEAGSELYRRDGRYRHGSLSLRRVGQYVQIGYCAQVIDTLGLPIGESRPRSIAQWAIWLRQAMNEWSAALPDRALGWREMSADLARDADELESSAETMTFSRNDELVAVEAKLAAVTAAIHQAADEQAQEQKREAA